jgi:hypothetical protein
VLNTAKNLNQLFDYVLLFAIIICPLITCAVHVVRVNWVHKCTNCTMVNWSCHYIGHHFMDGDTIAQWNYVLQTVQYSPWTQLLPGQFANDKGPTALSHPSSQAKPNLHLALPSVKDPAHTFLLPTRRKYAANGIGVSIPNLIVNFFIAAPRVTWRTRQLIALTGPSPLVPGRQISWPARSLKLACHRIQ